MSNLISARGLADMKFLEKEGKAPEHDGKRRVVMMKKANLRWEIDVGESASDGHARMIAESMSDDNGGGWKFDSIADHFSHEEDDE